jgi:cyclohexanone monooxygenase
LTIFARQVGTSFSRRCGFEIIGRNGLSLDEKWKDGVITMHGFFTNGFPNCYIVQLPQVSGQRRDLSPVLPDKFMSRILTIDSF